MLGLQKVRKEVALVKHLTCMTCTKTAKENLELAFKCRDQGRISAKSQRVLQLFNISCYKPSMRSALISDSIEPAHPSALCQYSLSILLTAT